MNWARPVQGAPKHIGAGERRHSSDFGILRFGVCRRRGALPRVTSWRHEPQLMTKDEQGGRAEPVPGPGLALKDEPSIPIRSVYTGNRRRARDFSEFGCGPT